MCCNRKKKKIEFSCVEGQIQKRAGWAPVPHESDLFITLVLISYKSLLISSFNLRLSPTIITQNTRPIYLWVALQVKGSIPIFSLLQQRDLKENTLCKWVSRRENTQIWVMPLLIPKMGFLYRYSVGGYRYYIGDPFWIWVSK